MRKLFLATAREQSRLEEIANSVSHGLGLVGALTGTPFLIMQAAQHGNSALIIGASLFSIAMVLLYFLSTLYHALPIGKAKRVFRTFEQAAIFIFIASTYTPFTLGVLQGALGWTLLGLIWGLAMIGVALLLFDKMSHLIIPTSLYLLMGWLIVIAFEPLFAKVPQFGVQLLIAGGVAYTVGVAFLAVDSHLRFGHLIWHLCVIAGTTCHYFAVLWYAV
ncbi:MAG: PAQR family membrane homeostasis protein TrhA [Methylomicrobium sp.]